MLTRSLLRDLVAGILVASGLVGAVAASHAQVAFWQQVRSDGRPARIQSGDGWQMASVRAESREHVQAQIDRMEARARADDRLSGRRAALAGARDDNRGRGPERNPPNDARNEPRQGQIGPGWQARGRDNGR
ncbi:hypothetical protein [Cupriavidus alkaliphilus]|uniref:Uncharacterized protein n=1 Tax=Cupriavidus alkaliphilus TaxID=942866 RepID=A0A1C3UDY3_9BURK|nr:hypothetical protein [Cupriavidus alkaliphilus]MBB2919042.1 hypothetical protein [Cupriavidus alkaliphilus]MBB3008476.1 hypothetical protein [Cupriavidus alkaliphilus]MBB3013471.1 hypothetical protein [Cupriavidus alkaliphilus]PVY75602.1 hypothetical protein C7414_111100 [Cupriavidus alkaliphilus]RAS12069.1 hypothetical protein C7415_101101 [Cupriavidus alkaliphilus]